MTQTGVRSGILIAILGLWVVLRSVNHDSTGQTLIDHILGGKTPPASTPAPTSPIAPSAPAPTAATQAAAAGRRTTGAVTSAAQLGAKTALGLTRNPGTVAGPILPNL